MIGLITSTSKISDNRRVWFRRLTKKGWLVVALGLVAIILAGVQYKQAYQKELQAEKQQNARDSIAHETINKNSRVIINSFSEALARYGLKYDSTNNKIQKILKDSTRKSITNNYGQDPVIIICPENGITGILDASGDSILKINLCNYNSSSRIIDFSIILMASEESDPDLIQYLIALKPLPQNTIMVGDQIKSITYKPSYKETKSTQFYILVKTNYTNTESSKKFSSDLLYSFKRSEGKGLVVSEPDSKEIRRLLKFWGKDLE